jgi:hypothetical protein
MEPKDSRLAAVIALAGGFPMDVGQIVKFVCERSHTYPVLSSGELLFEEAG